MAASADYFHPLMPNMDSFIFYTNEEKSVTPFYHKVAAWVHDMFFNFCLVKNI
jgi:hypothetical protein